MRARDVQYNYIEMTGNNEVVVLNNLETLWQASNRRRRRLHPLIDLYHITTAYKSHNDRQTMRANFA